MIAQSKRARAGSLVKVDWPQQVARTCILRKFLVCKCRVVFLWRYVCLVLFRFRIFAVIEAAALRPIVLQYACAPTVTRIYPIIVCVLFFFFLFFVFLGDVAFFQGCLRYTFFIRYNKWLWFPENPRFKWFVVMVFSLSRLKMDGSGEHRFAAVRLFMVLD